MKLTPPVDIHEKYFTPVMSACLVCAMLVFSAHKLPKKSEKTGELFMTAGSIT